MQVCQIADGFFTQGQQEEDEAITPSNQELAAKIHRSPCWYRYAVVADY